MRNAVAACPVCYGGADDKMMDGVQAGVLLLLAIIGSVLVGFAALFLRFRYLAKKVAQAEAAVHPGHRPRDGNVQRRHPDAGQYLERFPVPRPARDLLRGPERQGGVESRGRVVRDGDGERRLLV